MRHARGRTALFRRLTELARPDIEVGGVVWVDRVASASASNAADGPSHLEFGRVLKLAGGRFQHVEDPATQDQQPNDTVRARTLHALARHNGLFTSRNACPSRTQPLTTRQELLFQHRNRVTAKKGNHDRTVQPVVF